MSKWMAGGEKDLSGKRFWFLDIIEKDGVDQNRKTTYHAKCRLCGGDRWNARGTNIKDGHIKSCGCLKTSSGAKAIELLLQDAGYTFQMEYIPEDLNGKRFDFTVMDGDKIKFILEFDGKQHFNFDGNGWNTQDHWKGTVKRDYLKNQWTKENNIQLVRIPQWFFNKEKNVTLNNILPETSPYNMDNIDQWKDSKCKRHWKAVEKAKGELQKPVIQE